MIIALAPIDENFSFTKDFRHSRDDQIWMSKLKTFSDGFCKTFCIFIICCCV